MREFMRTKRLRILAVPEAGKFMHCAMLRLEHLDCDNPAKRPKPAPAIFSDLQPLLDRVFNKGFTLTFLGALSL